MMLKINGTQEFLGKTIKVVEGGFGEDSRVMTDLAIADIHDIKIIHVRELITKNRNRFKDDIDIVDLKVIGEVDNNLLENLGYSKMQISKSNSIFILSERGYGKLIKIMDSDKAWDIYDSLLDNYFTLRRQVKDLISDKDKAILSIVNAESDVERALAVKNFESIVVKPLQETIDRYDRFLLEGMEVLTKSQLAKRLDTSPSTLCAVLKKHGIYTPKTNEISVEFMKKYPDTKIIVPVNTSYKNPKTDEIVEKMDWQYSGAGAKLVVDVLVDKGVVVFTENKGFKLVK